MGSGDNRSLLEKYDILYSEWERCYFVVEYSERKAETATTIFKIAKEDLLKQLLMYKRLFGPWFMDYVWKNSEKNQQEDKISA